MFDIKEDIQPFVSGILNLWNLHIRRENLYKQAMGIDDLGTLRRICSQGYVSSLLFKKEIQWIYDQVKCALSDGDIENATLKDSIAYVFPWEDKTSVAFMLQEQEHHAMRIYKKLLGQRSITQEANYIFSDHLVKIEDINHSLSKELSKNKKVANEVNYSAA